LKESKNMTVDVTVASVTYGEFGSSAVPLQHIRKSTLPHDEVAKRVRRAVEAADLWVLGEVDAQALVKRGGYGIGGALQILAFHPRFLVRILEEDSSALLGAPIKFAILALDNETVAITWINQAAAFARYDRPALIRLGEELDAICLTIVDSALA